MSKHFLIGLGIATVISPSAQMRQPATEAPKGPWMDKSLPPDRRAGLILVSPTRDGAAGTLRD